ncbi:MAG: hypothetical protein F6K10_22435 [Moorea sp. SIO2B7]|nr:hypothetical protein [Moorena sp. SIO2B7]
MLDNTQVWRDVELPTQLAENSNNVANSNSRTNRRRKIVQATGWIIKENGDVFLVSDLPNQNSCH